MSQKSYQTPFTIEALESLESAILQGVQTVKYTDKEVTYRSLEEMMRVRALLRKKLGMDETCGEKGFFGGTRKVARHSKGLGDE